MDSFIELSSVTQALRAKEILKKKGIYSEIKRVPARRGKADCGYGLVIKKRTDEALMILSENNIEAGGRAVGDLF